MNIRRALATAVAAAVTAPVVMLSAGSAFADAQPPSQTQKKKPTIEELEKAAAEAKKAYDEALTAQNIAQKAVDAAMSDDAPLHVKAKAAAEEAGAATAAKTLADKAVTDAADILAALPADAKPEDRAAAQKVLDDAKKDAEEAAEKKKEADAKAAAALKEAQDAEVAALRTLHTATEATKKALAAKEAADQALADAKKEAEKEACEPGTRLITAALTGLPSKIAAGTTTDFSLRITNGTEKTLDRLRAFTYIWAADKSNHKVSGDLLHLQWSTARSGGWKDVDSLHRAGAIENLEAGAHADMKLRLTLDAKTPAGQGFAFVSAIDARKSCDGSQPPMDKYPFEILAAGTKPGTQGKSTPDAKPQGGTSTTPVNTAATGQLAATGSSPATPKLALAGGAAVVVGAGALLAARRRTDG
ncbi:LAETG motif-containing sortase-dependent surface protein [Streptomyces sp. BPTC-684]|uniref:LAETG motif-containing sortase-dependent surface protein n=1 Tax=Streptomyces sp. BPTC-684 TaxID=3043734 RepID=UPI0024B12833|nr:LAETG motif-containing sortase-dependent surface protein [Streptomyces sp. BPTC-684]WHM38421.1 LAETG motif-containing sortase-dependent surface protein [Streptomyces sp. BPTC-684]